MKLFDLPFDPLINILPHDGVVNYYGKVFKNSNAKQLMDSLLYNIDWKRDEVFIFGKKIITKRQVAWYADEPFAYTYSKSTKVAMPWTSELASIKKEIETISQEKYNSCLLNLYAEGQVGMGYHSDDEAELKRDGAIASVSLGAERKFVLKHKTSAEKVSLILEDGSLLVMKGKTQTYWQHHIPPTKKIIKPRINLTFRTYVGK